MIKDLEPVNVDGMIVHVRLREELTREPDIVETFLCVGAQCGATQVEASLTMFPSSAHTAVTLDRDIKALVGRVTAEAAVRERARVLREELFR